jgi:hypothetical protein
LLESAWKEEKIHFFSFSNRQHSLLNTTKSQIIAFIASVKQYRFAGGFAWPSVGWLDDEWDLQNLFPALASAASWQIFSCRLSKEWNIELIRSFKSFDLPKQEQSFSILLLLYKACLS